MCCIVYALYMCCFAFRCLFALYSYCTVLFIVAFVHWTVNDGLHTIMGYYTCAALPFVQNTLSLYVAHIQLLAGTSSRRVDITCR